MDDAESSPAAALPTAPADRVGGTEACRRWRIAHVITRLDLGGAQQNTLYCVAHHDRSLFDVELVAGCGGLLDDEARRIDDATVHLWAVLRHPIRPLHDLAALLRLTFLLRKRRIDLVHTHSSKAGIIGRLAARLAGVGVIVHTVHGWSFNPTQSRWRRRLYRAAERLVASCTDRIITVAEAGVRDGLEAGIGRPELYSVVRSGIDVTAFAQQPGRPSNGGGAEKIHVGTLACLKPQKDPLTLVRAAARVVAEEPQAVFHIAGDGELRGQVEALVQELGIADRVILHGWVEDAHAFLSGLDLFVLTSRFEGLPRAVLQAAAAGVPIVATAVDGTPEFVVNNESGLLVPAGDHDAIAAAILCLIRNSELRSALTQGARRRLRGSFEIAEMLHRIEEIYLELLDTRGGRGGDRGVGG